MRMVCERKQWADQAGAYNERGSPWPAAVVARHGVGHVGSQIGLL